MIGSVFKILGLLLLKISILSCSSVSIKSNNKANVSFDESYTHENDIQITIEKDFFLWGYFPKHEIFVDEVLLEQGIVSAKSVEVEQVQTLSDAIWTLVTFGVYFPKTYSLKAKSKDG